MLAVNYRSRGRLWLQTTDLAGIFAVNYRSRRNFHLELPICRNFRYRVYPTIPGYYHRPVINGTLFIFGRWQPRRGHHTDSGRRHVNVHLCQSPCPITSVQCPNLRTLSRAAPLRRCFSLIRATSVTDFHLSRRSTEATFGD